MARYVALVNWTDQGIRNYKDTAHRGEAFGAMLESMGSRLVDLVWTLGTYDIVAIIEAPDDETMTNAMLKLGVQGNVRTTTMRAFTGEEIERIVARG